MHHELILAGPVVRLEPLRRRHAEALAALAEPEALAFHTSPLPLTPELAGAEIDSLGAAPTTMPFAVLDTTTGELRGITAFYDQVPTVPRVEIGHTFYGRRFWGGDTNPSTKLLMLEHAFETWRCERVALRCDSENLRSAQAIRRLGARPEGILRAHRRRHDGTVADTSYFSILRADWPAVRQGLEARIATTTEGGSRPSRPGPRTGAR